MKRLFALASLLILGIVEIAPHRHADSLDLWLGDDGAPAATQHVIRCDGATGGVRHMHRDATRQTDSCLACLRQHLRATARDAVIVTPHRLRQFLSVTARVAHARSVGLRKTSRGPPLAS
ncbi:MAG TPA: hypothetical protein VKU62_00155 [Thermoanaerobaculia bacterium]|nr:hypothetical protein [Thermoanaerobaculia bacterium]